MAPRVRGLMPGHQKRSLKFEGVRLMNALPEEIRTYTGKFDDFKKILDLYLSVIPDNPETEDLKPGATGEDGKPSNSIVDWINYDNSLKYFPLLCEKTSMSSGHDE